MASQAEPDLGHRLCCILFAAFTLLLMVVASSNEAKSANSLPFDGNWQSEHFRDHPLVGSVFTGSGEKVDWSSVLDGIKRADVVIVGETHTNADHHTLQTLVAQEMKRSGRLFATVWEMVPQGLQPVLDQAMSGEIPLTQLGKALEWEKRGWGSFAPYQPVFETALNGDDGSVAKLIAGNPNANDTRALSRGGLDALPQEMVAQTGLDLALDERLQAGLIEEMAVSHCNMMPERILPNMALVQRLRDGMMAHVTKAALMDGTDSSQALIITGNGHARNDRGVPAALKGLRTGLFSLSIGLIDVSEDLTSFADYQLVGDTGEALYDFVVFTPRDNIDDPCEMMRQQMKARTKTKP